MRGFEECNTRNENSFYVRNKGIIIFKLEGESCGDSRESIMRKQKGFL